ncbi:acetyltransferase (GNAT) family domain-containing protein [Ditylenchus destructor]|uniref:N-alpha-acetyltransferase 60 n=1 Tax=Ditylenchus destructor TaxID=166010 RepID=A0AAD4R977_9BILA|nr:acetyltransferase (GNAT) family domain-containing protein [Ditylenchus destructor]
MENGETHPTEILISSGNTTPSSTSSSPAQTSPYNKLWQIRPLSEKDFDRVTYICRESFPLDYPECWFRDVVAGKFISFGMFHGELLTSLLVAEVKLAPLCDREDQDLCSTLHQQSYFVYILSLAVLGQFRRRGIATILLNHLMKSVVQQPPYPKMVFLHVLSKNSAAIQFYKRNGFRHYTTLPNYYQINEDGLNVFYDGYTFVIYTNGSQSPWSVRELCNLVMSMLCAPFRLLLRWKPPYRISTNF